MAWDAEGARIWRVETGRTTNLTVPVSVLAVLLADDRARSILHTHFGPDLCRAIVRSPKAREAA